MRIFIFCAEYNNVSVVMQIFVIHTFMSTVVLFVYINLHVLLLCSSAIYTINVCTRNTYVTCLQFKTTCAVDSHMSVSSRK